MHTPVNNVVNPQRVRLFKHWPMFNPAKRNYEISVGKIARRECISFRTRVLAIDVPFRQCCEREAGKIVSFSDPINGKAARDRPPGKLVRHRVVIEKRLGKAAPIVVPGAEKKDRSIFQRVPISEG